MVNCGSSERRPPVDDADWIAISELARARGVSKQAISKRVKALTTTGRLPARGAGRALRIHLPTFDRIVEATRDPAQDLRNRHNRSATVSPSPVIVGKTDPSDEPQETYECAAARDKRAMAALRELQLAERRKELVEVAELETAAVEIGTKLSQSMAALKMMSGKIYAAAKTGGEDAVHVLIVQAVDDVLRQTAAEMTKLATCAREENDICR